MFREFTWFFAHFHALLLPYRIEMPIWIRRWDELTRRDNPVYNTGLGSLDHDCEIEHHYGRSRLQAPKTTSAGQKDEFFYQ
jgi:hypothetical protein